MTTMIEHGFEKIYVIIDDMFEIAKTYPTEMDILKIVEKYERNEFGKLIVCKNPNASGKKIAIVQCNNTDCRISNYKSL